ncbi:MAG: hypothetical protein FJW40_12615 [Acidobacteria bacterium]|nr:hypothetical protein [Acidobacteriota bacterium]
MSVLVVASEAFELAGLRSRLTGRELLPWPVRTAERGILGDTEYFMIANGPGPSLASAAAREALARQPFHRVLSVGLCGGLHPQLPWNAIVVADSVRAPETGREFRVAEIRPRSPHQRGTVVSVDRIAQTPGEKSGLAIHGIAVEMEAAGVAAEAERAGIPFCCVKVVSDTAGEGFAIDFNAARDQSGRVLVSRILKQLLIKPQALGELIRLARRSRIASKTLGDFLADCRY